MGLSPTQRPKINRSIRQDPKVGSHKQSIEFMLYKVLKKVHSSLNFEKNIQH